MREPDLLGAPALLLGFIHRSAWKWNPRKSAYSIVRSTTPQNRRARSLAHPHSMTDSYMLWCWIDIRDRECSSATVESRIVARNSPAWGFALTWPTVPESHAFGGVASHAAGHACTATGLIRISTQWTKRYRQIVENALNKPIPGRTSTG
jgi:hypothetical protein